MEPKFKIGDRVVWEYGVKQPHGKITDGPIQGADKYDYVVLLDDGTARLFGELVLAFEEELGEPRESEFSRSLIETIKAGDELIATIEKSLRKFMTLLADLKEVGKKGRDEKKDSD